MGLWRQLVAGLRVLFRPGSAERDVADEVDHFLDEAVTDLVRGGATPAEARRAVRLRYGDPLPASEDVRAYGWESAVGIVVADLRLAFRRLVRSPGFTVVTAATLGLGIGAATTIYSAVAPALFEPLPYPESGRILAVADRADDGTALPIAFGSWIELSERATSFVTTAVSRPWQPALTGGDEPERLDGHKVTSGYFDVLGVTTAAGPGFDPAADRPAGVREVILSHELWRYRFGADPGIVGRSIRLDAEPYTVVGVMPAGFVDALAPSARVWSLLQYDPLPSSFETREWGRHLGMIARARADVDPDDVVRELDGIADEPVAAFPRATWTSMAHGFEVRRLRDAVTAESRGPMLVLLGAAALLLLVTCVNLTLLTLARGARRRGEFATRMALGAGRGRLMRYLMTEGLLVAGLGGLAGIALTRIGLDVLTSLAPPGLPGGGGTVDGMALGLALGLTALMGLGLGAAPALAGRGGSGLGEHGRGSPGRGWSGRRALVATEVALAVVLLVGAGLLVRSAQRLFAVPPGFEPDGAVVMHLQTNGLDDAGTHRFFDGALEAVRDLPGVRAVALTSQLPLSGEADAYGTRLDDDDRPEGVDGPAFRYAVTPGYLEAMGIPVRRGRSLEDGDDVGAPPVAVVSETLARRRFGERDPLGLRLRVGALDSPPYTIVGVVGDVKQVSLASDQLDAVYVTTDQWHWADRARWLVVHAEGDVTGLVPAVRRAVWSVDGDQPIVRVQSLDGLVQDSEAQRRFVLVVLLAFALAALLLAAIGLYGVLSGAVAERRREMGVRAALGASRQGLRALVVGQGLAVTALGAGVGLAIAAVGSRVLDAFLFEVSPLDPLTYAGVLLVLGSVAVAACWIPAARAAQVDPLRALRSD